MTTPALTCHSCKKRKGATCTASGKPFTDHVVAHANGEANGCPLKFFPSRGLGDTIAKMTGAIGIDTIMKSAGCGGCDGRQVYINKIVPYKP